MHIGFDISQAGRGRAGCGHFAHALAATLPRIAPQHRYAFYPSFGDFYFDPLMPLRNPYRGRDVRYGPRHLSRESAGAYWHSPALEARLGRPDIVHANNFWAPLQLAQSRLVYTCYDLGFMADPSWTTEANRVGCFDGMFRAACAADWIVAISRHTADDFSRHFPHFPADRVRVIHPSSRFTASVEGNAPRSLSRVKPGEFWLSVGTLEPRKNQRLLVQAYARHRARGGPAWPLVLAGGAGWLMDGFERELRELGIASQVILAGYVSDDELAWLYRHCRANLYPSRFEGFGLPVLEAMQFGAACVVSNASSMPEVAGEAALQVAPDDLDGWTNAFDRLGKDDGERARLQQAGIARARQFRADDSARTLLALYEEALETPKRMPAAIAA